MERALTPTGCAIALILAFVIDYMSAGPDSIRDRVAFLFALAGFRDGFDGSPLDRWTVQRAHDAIGFALTQADGAYIAGASANAIVGAGVGALALFVVGCLLPVRASKRLGRLAAISFPKSPIYRINWKLWLCAFLLGVLADLGRGLLGGWIEGAVTWLTVVADVVIGLLFGTE